ncbi:MAG: hypothetical protein M0007_12495, partial [Actinomycetota bacterium]|nr:hypothetical protein [Actinomycetota bacterium]
MAPDASLVPNTEPEGSEGRASERGRPRRRGGPPGTPTGHFEWVVVFSLVTLVLTYGLVVLGSTVRVTESGMGCASWPL